jgi:hypothetical protein
VQGAGDNKADGQSNECALHVQVLHISHSCHAIVEAKCRMWRWHPSLR